MTDHHLSRNFWGYCACGLKLDEHPGRWNFSADREFQYEPAVQPVSELIEHTAKK